jgi:hypothetical protein
MKWVAVESSAVSALGYEAGRSRLGIEFQVSRRVYIYHAVPPSEFKEFLEAESKGRYLTQVFLPKGYAYSGPYSSRRQAA